MTLSGLKHTIALTFILGISVFHAQIDSLKQLIPSVKNDTTYCKISTQIAWLYFDQSNYDSSIHYFHQTWQRADQKSLFEESFYAQNGYYSSLWSMGKVEEALKGFESLSALPNLNNDQKLTAFGNLAALNQQVGNFEASTEAYNTILELYKNKNDYFMKPVILVNLSDLHERLGNTELSQKYNQEALDLKLKNPSPAHESIAISYIRVAQDELYNKNYQESIALCKKAIEHAKKVNANREVVNGYQLISSVYLELNDLPSSEVSETKGNINYYDSAQYYGGLCIQTYEKHKIKELDGQISLFIGSYYEREKAYDNAIQLYKSALNFAKDQDYSLASSAAKNLYLLYKKFDADSALKYLEVKDSVENALNQSVRNQTLVKIEEAYENQLLQKENENVKLVNDQQQLELNNKDLKNKNLRIFLFSIIFILVILGLMFFRMKQLNKKLQKLSIVAEKIREPVLITDLNGKVEFSNKKFEETYGKSHQNIFDFSPEEQLKEIIDQAKASKSIARYITQVDNLWIQTLVNPVMNQSNDVAHLVFIDQDITELKDAEIQLSKRNKDLNDSIKAAQNIQMATLPSKDLFHNMCQEYFIWFQPKEWVGGDFYFNFQIGESNVLGVADCTGHGVPGALMSILCHNILEQVVEKHFHQGLDKIMNELSYEINRILQSSDSGEDHPKEALDISMMIKTGQHVSFCSTHQRIYRMRQGDLEIFKGDRIHLGYGKGTSKQFEIHELEITENDCFYFFSDGLPDQKGGADGKKYYYGRLQELLLDLAPLTLVDQQKKIKDNVDNWMKDQDQLDDILIMGIKF